MAAPPHTGAPGSVPGGRVVDRYEILSELGRGGMAVVYEARHLELGSRHAIKVFAGASRKLEERLLQEGKVQARLTHPHVVAVTDVITVDGNAALVLEFVEGSDLQDWLAAHPKAPDAVRRRLACQILSAVRHAHELGTVHRDLKPANVLVTGPEAEPWAKVADFGLAKWLQAADPGFTRSGVAMGTPRYMAPEQFRDAKRVDERADIFALGCLLAELWSGRPIFDGESLPDLFEQIASGTYEMPAEVPADVADAVRACLRPEPGERPQKVEDLAALIACGAAPPAVVAPIAPPPAKSSSSGLLVAGLGVALLAVGAVSLAAALVLCLGLGWSALPADEAEITPDVPEAAPIEEPRRRRPARPAPSPAPAPKPEPATDPEPAPKPDPAPAPRPDPEPQPGGGGPGGGGEEHGHGKDKDDKEDKEKPDKNKGKGR